jgi:hypothetical protein
MNRIIALRSLKNLCTFIGAVALSSYFVNFAVDLRHWYVTLASAFACAILWLGFYVIELRGGVSRVVAFLLSRMRTTNELPSPDVESAQAAEIPDLPADLAAHPPVNPAPNPPSNPLPWLRRAS